LEFYTAELLACDLPDLFPDILDIININLNEDQNVQGFDKKQIVYEIGGVKFGRTAGWEYPTVLVSTMFYARHKIVDR